MILFISKSCPCSIRTERSSNNHVKAGTVAKLRFCGSPSFLFLFAVLLLCLLFLPILLILLILLILTLILISVFHDIHSFSEFAKYFAGIVYHARAYLSFGLQSSPASHPKTIAAAIPPAVAVNPPVKMPQNPVSSTASRTPFAME